MHSHSEHRHSTETQSHCGCGHDHAKKQTGCSSQSTANICHDSSNSVSEHSHQEGGCCSQSSHTDDGDEESDRLANATPAGSQRFSWQVKGMDCPSCARKIENAVSNLVGIENVKVLFATEKLVVDARSDIRPQVQQAVIQAGFSLVDTQSPGAGKNTESESRFREYLPIALLTTLMLLSWSISLFSVELSELAFTVTTIVGLIPIVTKAWKLIRSGTPFAIETLMSVAAIGAMFIGATAEAAMVLLLFMVGELLESYAANRARRGVTALMALVPEEALLLKDGERRQVSVASLRPGDIIEVSPGGRLPADAQLMTPFASFDESALTGESVPVERVQGEKVAAGSLSVDRATEMRVISEPGNNAIDRILQLIELAEERRAPIERFIDRFSRIYTPAIMFLSALVILVPPLAFAEPWETWIYRGLTLLLIGCPCALVISTPAAITSALAAATRRGALIKGGAALEQLGRIQTVAFDKTGTLTEGKPQVTDILPISGVSETRLLSLAAAVEAGSHHPLAVAIMQRAQQNTPMLPLAEERRALAGIGVEGRVNGLVVRVSAPSKISPELLTAEWLAQFDELESSGKTAVAVLENEKFIGVVALRDTLRTDAKQAIDALKKLGIQGVMLTGDNPRAAAAIASELGIDYRAGLLPADKVQAVMALNATHPTVMVGDGINDAPAMKAASIGIAMGSGTDVALETADAALTHNRLTGLAEIILLSRAANANIRQNITIALGLKGIFLVTTLLGLTGLWLAVLADSGATALVTANALRLLRKRNI
ncbi:TPA: zinc/cadmium/mercury/lead-transporting ATPase [Yersinia enterocolitica]|uniref:P-type Zn(2+) transporter n=2 Tax=Yersinia enterocolitica TaxID=630 RepID=A0A0H5E444_YEREN|nr:zinc/cadmium/mercury/lead-transporting ATPase [Yersinia enterocolitica]CBX72746.1 lead, cadmium, zinc and mercury-transporting ATPase [Yersinia enterocolitica W22703]ADZ40715.1 zinc/cadmium/mercury/lead-transporting ATPase [Yersinia enterocolitica subsp. palearctica 105.5R(r)]ALG80384.1 zinc ABC transporter ATPase [Yersinia enterocolitica]EKN3326390.1 zinc/cadmium/mercury/lead-transporting ATPase [Yersinia enterocolitica]EKN3331192.1 zinc/cadmium/mercury/lead-transporting ATPase [Yersinia e